jgi:hypothetical protein
MHSLITVKVMKIFLGEATRFKGRPLHEAIVEEARQRGMAGATVSRGLMGFGASSLLHTSKILRLSEDLPIMVEIVDTPERIDAFVPVADAMVEEGSIVVCEAQGIFHLPLRIRDVMTANVATVTRETPLAQVVDLLLRREIKAVPVMDGNSVAGIITGGDLLSRGGMPLSLDMQCALSTAMRDEHVRCLDFGDLSAADVMTSPVQTLNIKTRVPEALRLMAKGGMKRLPVVADDGSLLGIVSRADVLRVMGRVSTAAGHLDVLPDGMRACASDVMYRSVPTARSDTPLAVVLDQLVASPLRRVVVVDADGRIQGIVHDRNLLQHFARLNAPGVLARLIDLLSRSKAGVDELEGVAGDVMATGVISVPPDMALSEVLRTLVGHSIKRVAVADESGRLLGMVDRDSVLKGLAG